MHPNFSLSLSLSVRKQRNHCSQASLSVMAGKIHIFKLNKMTSLHHIIDVLIITLNKIQQLDATTLLSFFDCGSHSNAWLLWKPNYSVSFLVYCAVGSPLTPDILTLCSCSIILHFNIATLWCYDSTKSLAFTPFFAGSCLEFLMIYEWKVILPLHWLYFEQKLNA